MRPLKKANAAPVAEIVEEFFEKSLRQSMSSISRLSEINKLREHAERLDST